MDNPTHPVRDVAFSCDDNGAKFLCVTVGSLLAHYKGVAPLRINVFEGFGGHSTASKAKLRAVVDSFNQAAARANPRPAEDRYSVRYHDVEPFLAPYRDILKDRPGSRWNVFTWTPVFTPQILADATGNVAHFDIDMLFNDDVSKILDIDLSGCPRINTNDHEWEAGHPRSFAEGLGKDRPFLIAAVAEYGKGDPVITEAVWGKGILPPSVTRYFNTGTIVFNAAACRAERTWEKILAWYHDHYAIADRIEQDAWNALYHDRTRLLPLRWNFHDRLIKSYVTRNLQTPLWQGNPPKDCLEAALDPAILHFWGPKKPWKPCHRPYRKLYHAAMKAVGQTPPREELLGWWQDMRTRRALSRIGRRYREAFGKAEET